MESLISFLAAIGSCITQLISWLASVTTGLMSNEIFVLAMAIIIFLLLFGVVVGLAKGIRGRRRGRR